MKDVAACLHDIASFSGDFSRVTLQLVAYRCYMNENMTLRRFALGAMALSATLLVAGCGPSEGPQPTDSPSDTQTTTDDCATLTGDAAVQNAIDEFDDQEWSAELSDASDFDACATLSWVTLKAESEQGTLEQIVFFNEGEAVGQAYEEPFAFTTDVTALGDDAATVTWTFPEQIDRNGDPQTKAASTYTWNANTGSVDRDGQLPPYAGDDWNTIDPVPDN